MERHIKRLVSEWSALKDKDVLEFLRDSMPHVSRSNLPVSQLAHFLDFADQTYQQVRLKVEDDLIATNNRVAAQWRLVCSRPQNGLVVPESLSLGGADFIRSSGGMIRDLDVYFDFNDVAAVQRLLMPSVVALDDSVSLLQPTNGSVVAPDEVKIAQQAYRKSGLSAAAMDDIAQRLEREMIDRRLYLQSDMNLAKLAASLNVRSDYLSQVISQRFESSFYQILACHRVEEAKRLLLESPSLPAVEIGYAAGFNSKSVFYSEFRKHTGMTPAAYRKQCKQSK